MASLSWSFAQIVVFTILGVISIVWSLFVPLFMLWNGYCRKREVQLDKGSFWLFILSLIPLTLFYCNIFVYTAWTDEYPDILWLMLTILFMSMIFVSSAMFNIRQLYITFEESIYQISHTKIIVLCINVIIAVLLMGFGFAWSFHHETGLYLLIGFFVLQIGDIYVECTFYRNLFSLILSIRQSISSQLAMDINDKQIRFLRVLIKKSLLFFLNKIFVLTAFTGFFLPIFETENQWFGFLIYYTISGWISLFCRCLIFKMNQKYYNASCKICDKGCQKICEYFVRKAMRTSIKYNDHYSTL